MRRRVLPVLLTALAASGLAAPFAGAQLRDLGAFGPTCPLEMPPPPSRPRARLSLSDKPPERLRVTTRLEFAPGLRKRRIVPSKTPWPPGAPTTLAFVGTDPASLEIVRALPAGSGVYVVSIESWQEVRAIEAVCPRCLIQPGSDAVAALFGLTHYPALVQWTGREFVVTEGLP